MSMKTLCVVCAYRGTCQKRFNMPAGRHCPEFERDMMIKAEPEENEETKPSQPGPQQAGSKN